MIKIISRKTGDQWQIGDKVYAVATIKSINTRADTITYEVTVGSNEYKFSTTVLIENSPFEFVRGEVE